MAVAVVIDAGKDVVGPFRTDARIVRVAAAVRFSDVRDAIAIAVCRGGVCHGRAGRR